MPALCSVVALLLIGATPPVSPDLVRNPGFEDGAAGWSLPATYSVVGDTAHEGAHSLRVVNDDPKVYLLATQEVPCRPGKAYRFGAWVKAAGVKGDENGATVCMEWGGPSGWIGGTYPAGPKGDSGWTYVQEITPAIPANATRVTLSLYLRKGMTGTAWFDDVRLEPYSPPFDAALLLPAYRGTLWPDDRDQRVLVRARVPAEVDGVPVGQLTVRCALLRGTRVLRSVDRRPGAEGPCDLPLDARRLPAGEYVLRVLALGPRGRELARKDLAFRKLATGAARPAVYVDRLRRTIVRGKPFFPLGLYFGPGPDDPGFRQHIDRVAASPFNCIMCYGVNAGSLPQVRAYLDYLASRNVKIVYSIKDVYAGTQWYQDPVLGFHGEDAIVRGVVGAFRDHPALLGWYLNDELPLTMRDRLEARYRLVCTLDPEHPTWSVLYQVDQMAGYVGTADVLGSDPYPVPRSPVTMAADWAEKTAAASGGYQAIWQVPQAFDWGVYEKDAAGRTRPPTRDEMLVMTYLALIHGARGLVYYSYSDMLRDAGGLDRRWADAVAVAAEVKRLEPALLGSRAPARVTVTPDRQAVHHAALADDAGATYVLLANPDPKEPATVRVAAPARARLRLLRPGADEALPAPTAGQPAVVTLPAMGVATLVIGR